MCLLCITEAHIAESLLGIIKEIEHMPIDQVADKCHISKSTLSKVVKRLGFEDYKEFRDNARNEKKRAGYHNYEEKVPMDRFIEQYGIERFLSVLSGDIEHFLSGIDRNRFCIFRDRCNGFYVRNSRSGQIHQDQYL